MKNSTWTIWYLIFLASSWSSSCNSVALLLTTSWEDENKAGLGVQNAICFSPRASTLQLCLLAHWVGCSSSAPDFSSFCSGLHKTDIPGLCHSLSGWLFPGEDLYLKNSLLSFTLILLIPLTAVVTSDVWAFHNKQFWYLLTGVSARSHKTAPLQTPIESSCPHFCMTWL